MRASIFVTAIVFVFLMASISYATNGMNMISYGGQESGMAGASLGVSDNPMAMNNNPAGLTQIKDSELIVGISLLMPNLKHMDSVSPLGSNDKNGENKVFPLPTLAYAKRIPNSKVVLGIGIFAQGGMGADFKDLKTAFGTKDRTYTNVRYAKITPTIAYQFTDRLSGGVALNVGYSDVEMEFFPDTFFPGGDGIPPFAGMDLEDEYAFGYGAKIGLMYKISEDVNIGLVYTTRSELNYDNGKMEFRGPAPIGGKYDAEMEGFTWPASLGAGIGIRPTERLLLAADITWVNWSDAIETVKIKTDSKVPGMRVIPFKMDWEDQVVVAIGSAYKSSDNLTLRIGYNYGKNPVPAKTLSPLFPAIVEHHLTVGFGYKIGEKINLDGAWEHGFNKSVKYYNRDAPFGPGAKEEHYQNTVHLYLTYKF